MLNYFFIVSYDNKTQVKESIKKEDESEISEYKK